MEKNYGKERKGGGDTLKELILYSVDYYYYIKLFQHFFNEVMPQYFFVLTKTS
jgi:hypothetical protein